MSTNCLFRSRRGPSTDQSGWIGSSGTVSTRGSGGVDPLSYPASRAAVAPAVKPSLMQAASVMRPFCGADGTGRLPILARNVGRECGIEGDSAARLGMQMDARVPAARHRHKIAFDGPWCRGSTAAPSSARTVTRFTGAPRASMIAWPAQYPTSGPAPVRRAHCSRQDGN